MHTGAESNDMRVETVPFDVTITGPPVEQARVYREITHRSSLCREGFRFLSGVARQGKMQTKFE